MNDVHNAEPGHLELPLDGRTVWLTSQWGFSPGEWGMVGFTDPIHCRQFLENTHDGALVAIYVTKNSPYGSAEREKGRLVGVVEVTREVGHARKFIEPAEYRRKELAKDQGGRWNNAIRVRRAWKILPEYRPVIEEFADETYPSNNAQRIAGPGVPLTPREVGKLAQLPVVEVSVYGSEPPETPLSGPFQQVLGATRAVPPGSARDAIEEIIGPRHLYVLRLDGPTHSYLGRDEADVAEMSVVKVGLSYSPEARRDAFQAAMPKGVYNWVILHSTLAEGRSAYPTFDIARAGEDRMKDFLQEHEAEWLGGEFYLAGNSVIEGAWNWGKATANNAEDNAKKEK